jgi:hypothetical protein
MSDTEDKPPSAEETTRRTDETPEGTGERPLVSRSRAVLIAVAIGVLALGAIVAITVFLSNGFDSFAKKAARMMSPEPEEGAASPPPNKVKKVEEREKTPPAPIRSPGL